MENFPQKGRLSGKKRGLKGIVGHSLVKGGFRNKVWEDDREECWAVFESGQPSRV